MAKPVRESEILASSLVNSVTQALGKLLDLWNEMGISRELQLERMQTAKAHIEALLNEMIEEENNLKEKIENDIEIQKSQLNILRYELKLDPYQVDDGLSIIQLEKEFRLALEGALKEKQERLKKMKQLQLEEQTLCSELYATPYYIPTGSVPSCLELEELEEHVQQLLKVKEERLKEFFKLRGMVRQYNKEIGHIPDGTLENDMLSDEECICLTKKNLEDLELLVHKLQVKKDSLIASRDILVKEVQVLWDRLQQPQEKQEQFTMLASRCPISDAIKMWEEELQNLEMLKKEGLKQITFRVRQELHDYWGKCFYSEEQRAVFQPLLNDNFSEELLSQHDEELVKIKHFYEKNKHLYDDVSKWNAIWERLGELEKKSTDPSRLLNRGGTLLKEERERSKLQKQLLKLGEDLKKAVEDWEKENNSHFLIKNQRFLDLMAHQLQHHKIKKDQPIISVKRKECGTPRSADKRPAGGVNIPPPSKMRKVASNLIKTSSCVNIGTSVVVPERQTVQTMIGSKSTDSLYRSPLEECQKSHSTNQLSYSDFMKALSVKNGSSRILNSTVKENFSERVPQDFS